MAITQTPLHDQANLQLLDLIPQVSKVVEVGCSSGALANAYKQRYPETFYCGIEIDPNYAVSAQQYCDQVLVADLDALATCPSSSFLQAACWVFGDCLEHLVDPWQVLNWVNQHQKISEVICSCIPNSQHWSMQMSLSTGCWNYQESGLLDRTHLRFFTYETIISLFSQAGYKVKSIKPRITSQIPSSHILDGIRSMAKAGGHDEEKMIDRALPIQYLVVAEKIKHVDLVQPQ